MSMSEYLLTEGANAVVRGRETAIGLEAVDADDVVSGDPAQGVAEIGTIGNAEVGIWELRGGVVTDTEVDELFVVLSGGASIEMLDGPEAGTTVVVGPGDVMRLVAGTRTRWTVEDHIRKVYIAAE
jgi:uncharacterized cupin superfamily protein